jgi:hypothetical protein
MTELFASPAFSRVASVSVANLLIVAGLACMAIAIFGWFSGTIADGITFRLGSGLAGTLLLLYVYGMYVPVVAHARRAAPGPMAQEQSAQTRVPQSAAPVQAASMPPATQAAAQPARQCPFAGKWKNNDDSNSAEVVFLKVEQQGARLSVRAWGLCAGQYCDWGTGQGVVSGNAALVTWDQGPVQRRMRLLLASGSLRMVLDSSFKGHRPARHAEEHFAKSL